MSNILGHLIGVIVAIAVLGLIGSQPVMPPASAAHATEMGMMAEAMDCNKCAPESVADVGCFFCHHMLILMPFRPVASAPVGAQHYRIKSSTSPPQHDLKPTVPPA